MAASFPGGRLPARRGKWQSRGSAAACTADRRDKPAMKAMSLKNCIVLSCSFDRVFRELVQPVTLKWLELSG